MTTPGEPSSATPPPTGPTREFVVPDSWASHVAMATLRRTVTRPRFWTRVGLGILVTIPLALAGGRGWLALAPAVALISLAVTYLRTERSVAAALPAGSVATTKFLDGCLVSRTAHSARTIRYDEIRRIDVRDEVVFLEMATEPPLLVLPRALVPDDLR